MRGPPVIITFPRWPGWDLLFLWVLGMSLAFSGCSSPSCFQATGKLRSVAQTTESWLWWLRPSHRRGHLTAPGRPAGWGLPWAHRLPDLSQKRARGPSDSPPRTPLDSGLFPIEMQHLTGFTLPPVRDLRSPMMGPRAP